MQSLSLGLLFLLAISCATQAQELALPAGEHRQLVIQNCLACHSEKLIMQNRMTRKGWDDKITWMQKTQRLWEIDKDIRRKILDYLETSFGVTSADIDDVMDGIGPRAVNPLPVSQSRATTLER